MSQTVESVIQEAVQTVLALPPDELQNDIIALALAHYNRAGLKLWLKWPFDNEKREVELVTSTAEGIITFDPTVESVRFLRQQSATGDTDTPIWNEDELLAAAQGESITEDRFQHLSDSTLGYRRVKVYEASANYWAYTLSRFVRAIVDPNYAPGNPTATPTDYRVATFTLDRAIPALIAEIEDGLRAFAGIAKEKEGDDLFGVAVQRETYDSQRERRLNPRAPMFAEIEDIP